MSSSSNNNHLHHQELLEDPLHLQQQELFNAIFVTKFYTSTNTFPLNASSASYSSTHHSNLHHLFAPYQSNFIIFNFHFKILCCCSSFFFVQLLPFIRVHRIFDCSFFFLYFPKFQHHQNHQNMKLKPRISISSKHQQQQPIISTKSNSENQKRNKSRNPEFQQN
ncbi:hypothetical protein QL285_094482 [Trifolium repens]|nr:hypothetical protein QL285_094482 [Trifolium repens]